jgi:hypothetical protein
VVGVKHNFVQAPAIKHLSAPRHAMKCSFSSGASCFVFLRRHLLQLARPAESWQSRGVVSLNVNPPSFSHCCDRISADLTAIEIEQYLERLADPNIERSWLVCIGWP